jgi:hypothetical protein
MHYQIINLETGEFEVVTLEQAAEIAALDPADIEWAIESMASARPKFIRSRSFLNRPKKMGNVNAGDGDSIIALPDFVYISQDELEAHLAQSPAAVIR